jgi:hypothetical protein
MALLIIPMLVLAWIALGVVVAGLCRAARRGDDVLARAYEAERPAAKPRWVLDRDPEHLVALR